MIYGEEFRVFESLAQINTVMQNLCREIFKTRVLPNGAESSKMSKRLLQFTRFANGKAASGSREQVTNSVP